MPGIFGAIDVEEEVRRRLVKEWRDIWPQCSVVECGNSGLIGGLSLCRSRSVERMPGDRWIAVDGDASIRSEAAPATSGLAKLLHGVGGSPFILRKWCRANLAFIDTGESRLELRTESTGSFPLYVAQYQNGLLFSSLLRPLARATKAGSDPLGSLQFLKNGYTYAGRTPFRNILRLQAGQRVTYTTGRCRTLETSQLWAGGPVDAATTAEIAEEVIPLLQGALSRGALENSHLALMMSAGWDSRTLLALLSSKDEPEELIAYSHGDRFSRELRLSGKASNMAGVRCHVEEIDHKSFFVPAIENAFPKTECAIFPYWIRSGQLLGAMGVNTVIAGVFGEVLGGHYGETMVRQGRGKVAAFVSSLLTSTRMASSFSHEEQTQLKSILGTTALKRPWYLSEEVMSDDHDLDQGWNQDVGQDIDRLISRGIESATGIIEAFISESRGGQYINAQLLGCRADIVPSLPYIDHTLLSLVTRTPLSSRLHNRVNARVIESLDPTLLRIPLAATLVPASAPLLVQEASRVSRKLYEAFRGKLHARSGGKIRDAHLGWANFDFLRNGNDLMDLVDSLQGDQWDRKALRTVVSGMKEWEPSEPVKPLANQLGKIHTVDMLMR